MNPLLLSIVPLAVAAACAARPSTGAGQPGTAVASAAFWDGLHSLCGKAFEGRMVVGTERSDATFAAQRMVMHVRDCTAAEVRVPFQVGEDRSRTWVITRHEHGLRLKHDHRHADGSPDDVTLYGGDARPDGTGQVQHFPADAFTAKLLPKAATNVWTLELRPSELFAYALRREAEGRHFRVEFDLTRPVPPPAPQAP